MTLMHQIIRYELIISNDSFDERRREQKTTDDAFQLNVVLMISAVVEKENYDQKERPKIA